MGKGLLCGAARAQDGRVWAGGPREGWRKGWREGWRKGGGRVAEGWRKGGGRDVGDCMGCGESVLLWLAVVAVGE